MALEGIQEILGSGEDSIKMSRLQLRLQGIFPELKESEDEKVRKEIIDFLKLPHPQFVGKRDHEKWIAWLEKQGNREIDYSQNHQDSDHPNGCIVLEDFNGGDGFYKVNLDYLNKKQIEEIEKMVKVWNKESNSSNENIIKACIGMCLTDADEQRFKDYNTNLKDCLDWLKKQGEKPMQGKQKPAELGGEDKTKLMRKCVHKAYQRGYETGSMMTANKMIHEQGWSEDDNLYYDDICEILMNLLHSERTSINKAAVQKDLDWLGRIKEKTQRNKEDATGDEIINYFKCQSRDEPSRKDTHNKWISWIKDRK